MNKRESIDEMLTRFTKITNNLSSLGDAIDNDQMIKKVIKALPKSWEVKATTLKELNNREEMDFSDFIENLKPMRWRWRFEKKENLQRRRPSHLKSLHP